MKGITKTMNTNAKPFVPRKTLEDEFFDKLEQQFVKDNSWLFDDWLEYSLERKFNNMVTPPSTPLDFKKRRIDDVYSESESQNEESQNKTEETQEKIHNKKQNKKAMLRL